MTQEAIKIPEIQEKNYSFSEFVNKLRWSPLSRQKFR